MKPVPTLSLSGWVNEIREKSDRLLSYFFTVMLVNLIFITWNVTSFT